MSPCACASHTNHGSRESGSGNAPRSDHALGHGVVQVVVGLRPAAVVVRQPLREHHAEHGRDTREHVWQAALPDDVREPRLHRETGAPDGLERVRVAQDRQHLRGGRRRDPVARVRATVADPAGQDLHDLPAPTECGDGVAVAHRLGIGRQVRRDPEQLGGTTARGAEAGLDLVEDEQRAELLGHRPDALEEPGPGQDALGIAEDRFDEHRGDPFAIPLEDPPEAVQVVVDRGDDRLGDGLRDTPAPREAYRLLAVAELGHIDGQHADEGVVVDAVVLALELDDKVPARVAPGHADGVHRGLGARHRQAHQVAERHLAHELGRDDLVLRGQAEAHAAAHALVDMVVHARVGMAQDDRAVAHPQVDVLVPVDVPDDPASAPVDVDRVLAPRAEVGVRAPRKDPAGPLVHRVLAHAGPGRPRQPRGPTSGPRALARGALGTPVGAGRGGRAGQCHDQRLWCDFRGCTSRRSRIRAPSRHATTRIAAFELRTGDIRVAGRSPFGRLT